MTRSTEGTGPSPAGRRSALEGGRDLATREVVGILLSTLAMIFVLRQLGVREYGLVGFGMAVSQYAAGLATVGLNVFLLRHDVSDGQAPGQILTLAAMTTFAVTALILLAAPLAASFLNDPDATVVMRLVAVCVMLKGLSQIPVALLERDMDFGKIARIDFASLAIYYLVLVPLVYIGWGAVGVWTANAVQTAVTAAAYFVAKPIRPTTRLRRGFARSALAFGVGYQGSTWLYSLRDLAGPVLLPAFAGPAALGVYTATVQIVQRMGFLRTVVWRVALPGIARLQSDSEAASQAINRAMLYVSLLLGGALSLLCATAMWLIPLVFSADWEGVPALLPYVAFAALLGGVFAPHSAALVASGDLRALSVYHAAMVVLVWGAATALTPRLGVLGMGIAEMVGCLSYFVLARFVSRRYELVRYRTALAVCAAATLPMIGALVLSPIPAFLVWCVAAGSTLVASPASRSAMLDVMRTLPRLRTSG